MRRLGLFVAAVLCAACSKSASAPGAPSGSDSGADSGLECSGGSAEVRECVSRPRLEADLQFVAQPRSPGSPHWQAVQDLCKSRFEQYGLTVELHAYSGGVNVIGTRAGTTDPSEHVLVSAHYDHIPGCAGADDNATGVAALLETARVTQGRSFPRTLALACWDQEEDGLLGAKAYALRARQNDESIVVMYSLEMLGFKTTAPNTQAVPAGIDILFPEQYAELEAAGFVGDFLTIIADTPAMKAGSRVAAHAKDIGLRTVSLEISATLKSSPLAGDIRRSDHAAFWDQDFPAMMLTDTSEFRNPNYHCRNGLSDTVDTLDLQFLTDNARAVVGSVVDVLMKTE